MKIPNERGNILRCMYERSTWLLSDPWSKFWLGIRKEMVRGYARASMVWSHPHWEEACWGRDLVQLHHNWAHSRPNEQDSLSPMCFVLPASLPRFQLNFYSSIRSVFFLKTFPLPSSPWKFISFVFILLTILSIFLKK